MHDRLFKRVFQFKDDAQHLLRSSLPPEIVRLLDWSSLRGESNEFVDPLLRVYRLSLIFSAALHGSKECVYFLLDHRNPGEAVSFLEIHRDLHLIWDRWRGDHVHSVELPRIVPLVIEHGRATESEAKTLFVIPEPTNRPIFYPPSVPVFLHDPTGHGPTTLRKSGLSEFAQLALLCLGRAPGNASFLEELRDWTPELQRMLVRPYGLGELSSLVTYLLHVDSRPRMQGNMAIADWFAVHLGIEVMDSSRTFMLSSSELAEQC